MHILAAQAVFSALNQQLRENGTKRVNLISGTFAAENEQFAQASKSVFPPPLESLKALESSFEGRLDGAGYVVADQAGFLALHERFLENGARRINLTKSHFWHFCGRE